MRFVVLSVCVALVAPAGIDRAEACGWVVYTGASPRSRSGRAIERAMKKKKWQKALDLIAVEEARAAEHFDKKRRHDFEQLLWHHGIRLAYQKATAQFRLGHLPEARKTFKTVLRRLGQANRKVRYKHEIYLLGANIESALGDLKAAIRYAGQAVRARRRDPRLYSSLGTFLEADGQLEKAEKALAQSVRLNPRHHGGMEWVHLEVIRFRIQLRDDPESAETRPFVSRLDKKLKGKKLERALAFAARLAPELPIRP